MANRKIGYIRVSSFEQNPEHQLGTVRLSKCFVDRSSGKNATRPQLEALLDFVYEGDTVIVPSMDRLARSLNDLCHLVTQLTSKKVNIEFLKEGLTFTGKDLPMSFLSIMSAFAEFERSLTRERKERQMEGIALAKKRGAYKGRKPSLAENERQEIKSRIAMGDQKSRLAQEYGISRETLYHYVKNAK